MCRPVADEHRERGEQALEEEKAGVADLRRPALTEHYRHVRRRTLRGGGGHPGERPLLVEEEGSLACPKGVLGHIFRQPVAVRRVEAPDLRAETPVELAEVPG